MGIFVEIVCSYLNFESWIWNVFHVKTNFVQTKNVTFQVP
jgi:hypothetical protein